MEPNTKTKKYTETKVGATVVTLPDNFNGIVEGYIKITDHAQQTASLKAELDAIKSERTAEQAAALTENKKLRNLLAMVLDIDAMTTKEFCDIYRQEHPTYKGSIDLAVFEMFAVDSHKWHLIKDRAKEVRTAINQTAE